MRLIDLLCPILRLDLFNRYRDCFLSAICNGDHVLDDLLSQPILLLL